MPAPAKPRPKPPVPDHLVEVAGTQEQFQTAGFELAAKLGWQGEPNDETNDIDVVDAQNFLVKTLHEFFQAGAKGEDLPDHGPVCLHLALADEAEVALVCDAVKAAFQSGKGTPVELVKKKTVPLGANLIYDGSKPGKGG